MYIADKEAGTLKLYEILQTKGLINTGMETEGKPQSISQRNHLQSKLGRLGVELTPILFIQNEFMDKVCASL